MRASDGPGRWQAAVGQAGGSQDYKEICIRKITLYCNFSILNIVCLKSWDKSKEQINGKII